MLLAGEYEFTINCPSGTRVAIVSKESGHVNEDRGTGVSWRNVKGVTGLASSPSFWLLSLSYFLVALLDFSFPILLRPLLLVLRLHLFLRCPLSPSPFSPGYPRTPRQGDSFVIESTGGVALWCNSLNEVCRCPVASLVFFFVF